MRFEWDDLKNASNLRKHRVGFETGSLVFDDPLHVTVQDRFVDGEERWQTVGLAEDALLLLVAHTLVVEDEEVMRIISVRKANVRERRDYEGGL